MESELWNPFVSTDDEVEVDDETAAAIRLGAEDFKAGRVVSLQEAREHLEQWLSKSNSQNKH